MHSAWFMGENPTVVATPTAIVSVAAAPGVDATHYSASGNWLGAQSAYFEIRCSTAGVSLYYLLGQNSTPQDVTGAANGTSMVYDAGRFVQYFQFAGTSAGDYVVLKFIAVDSQGRKSAMQTLKLFYERQ